MSSSLVHAFRVVERRCCCVEIPARFAGQLQFDADALDDFADGAGVDAVMADLHFVLAW